MATLTLSSSNWDVGQLRITYTASNGTLKITEIEGKRSGGYRSWDVNDTSITVSVGGTNKTISLSHYIDFGNNEWTTWGATDTSWTGLSGTSISVSITMPSSTTAYTGAKFTGNATMSWTKYTIAYDANGGSGAPSSQTKTHGTNLTLSSTKPTKTGYTFKGWALTKADADNGTWYYQAGSTCGRNENLTLYAVWEENILTINYYSNYATSAFSDALNTVGSDKNVLVYTNTIYYDNDYSTYGLPNYSNSSGSVYMTRTGYTATGKWGTSASGGTLVDENTGFATGQALAKALGKDISSGNASINVYAQWRTNILTIKYHPNGGKINSDKYNISNNLVGLISSSSVLEDKWNYNNGHTDGLYNAKTFGLIREGYKFIGWKIGSSGVTVFDQDDTFIVPTDLASNLTTGDRTVTLYAVWEISGAIYIDNGVTLEPYLAYIDNGSSWDLYLAYVDNGTSWDTIS